ncbi:MAG: 5-deoxy-glucuronate isomerase [Bilifractor sp.]|jgi:5-deoxy-glucuronate isomerase
MEEKKLFGYPKFDEKGEMILCTYDNAYRDMLMDVRIYRIPAGETREYGRDGEECAVLLFNGKVTFGWDGKTETVYRKDIWTDGPYCVHVCCGEKITVKAESDIEIYVQYAKNDNKFEGRLYRPEDCPWKYSGVNKYGNVAKRRVNTIVDHDINPKSNFVLGEIMNDRGNWSGYLPHRHPQPELYFFRFDRPEGFGASFVGDQVFKSVDYSFSTITENRLHPQAVAPGYQMYTVWAIRHFDGNPWLQTDRNVDERYLWLDDAQF